MDERGKGDSAGRDETDDLRALKAPTRPLLSAPLAPICCCRPLALEEATTIDLAGRATATALLGNFRPNPVGIFAQINEGIEWPQAVISQCFGPNRRECVACMARLAIKRSALQF